MKSSQKLKEQNLRFNCRDCGRKLPSLNYTIRSTPLCKSCFQANARYVVVRKRGSVLSDVDYFTCSEYAHKVAKRMNARSKKNGCGYEYFVDFNN